MSGWHVPFDSGARNSFTLMVVLLAFVGPANRGAEIVVDGSTVGSGDSVGVGVGVGDGSDVGVGVGVGSASPSVAITRLVDGE